MSIPKEITLKFLGIDYWGRQVFQDVERGYYYKRDTHGDVDRNYFLSTTDFEGEPAYPIKKEIIVHIANKEEADRALDELRRGNY